MLYIEFGTSIDDVNFFLFSLLHCNQGFTGRPGDQGTQGNRGDTVSNIKYYLCVYNAETLLN